MPNYNSPRHDDIFDHEEGENNVGLSGLSDLDLGSDEDAVISAGSRTIDYHLHLAEECRAHLQRELAEHAADEDNAAYWLDETCFHVDALKGRLPEDDPRRPPLIPPESWSSSQKERVKALSMFCSTTRNLLSKIFDAKKA